MNDPRQIHEAALVARGRDVAALETRANAIGTGRLVVIVAVVALIGAIVWAHVASIAWVALGALVLAFAVLVVVHSRVHVRKDRAVAAVRFHERALARMAGRWRTFASNGQRWAVDTHPYAGDLDVFGRASLFQLLDATSTRFGEETLAKWIAGEEGPGDFAIHVRARQAAVRDIAGRVALREELAVLGSLLEDDKPDPRPFVMWAAQPPRAVGPSSGMLKAIALVFPIVSIGVAILSSIGEAPRFLFAVSFAASVAVLLLLRPRIAPILEAASSNDAALSRYAAMLAIVEKETFEAEALVALKARLLESGASATREMRAMSTIVGFLDARNNEVFRFLIAPILMWDLWCALALEAWRARAGKAAFGWFRALAELEALSSLGGFAFERPDHVFPELVDEPVLEATALGHPLIESDKRVANDVTIAGPGQALVVTGSNMSGKSTLLRALGINVVLANAGAPVCARSLRLGRLVVATSMRVSDSLDEGTSRFYAELKKLKLVLDLAKNSDDPTAKGTVLFLLDEILHGTNTRERLIGARAILRELLRRRAMGAVSTHDLGLGDLEAETPDQVRNVHFEEQVSGETMTFDYKLRRGIVQSSNALRLMRVVGLDVVSEV